MKVARIIIGIFLILFVSRLFSQEAVVNNSPAVVAKRLHAEYGVRSDAILAILKVFEEEGLDASQREAKAEQLIQSYSSKVNKPKGVTSLTEEDLTAIGIQNLPRLATALNWDLFAKSHYLTTLGTSSPAILASGEVRIWYGIPEEAIRAIAKRMEETEIELAEFEERLIEASMKYGQLLTEAKKNGKKDVVVEKVEDFLKNGKLIEAERLLDSDYPNAKRRFAVKAHIYGRTKELLLKYEEAAVGYRDAVEMDTNNLEYLDDWAYVNGLLGEFNVGIENVNRGILLLADCEEWRCDSIRIELLSNKTISLIRLGNFLMAQKAINEVQSIFSKWKDFNRGLLVEFFLLAGDVSSGLGSYEFAKNYHDSAQVLTEVHSDLADQMRIRIQGALSLDYLNLRNYQSAFDHGLEALRMYGEDTLNYEYAISVNNLGLILTAQGRYEDANKYLRRSIRLRTLIFGENHVDLILLWNNLGHNYLEMGEWKFAKGCFDKSIEIYGLLDVKPKGIIGTCFTNLSYCCLMNREFDMAILRGNEAIIADSSELGINHPFFERDLGNLGMIYLGLRKFDLASLYFERIVQMASNQSNRNQLGIASISLQLGYCYANQARWEESIEKLQVALNIMHQIAEVSAERKFFVRSQIAKLKSVWSQQLLQSKDHAKSMKLAEEAIEEAAQLGDMVTAMKAMVTVGLNEKATNQHKDAFETLEGARQQAVAFAAAFEAMEDSLPDSVKTSPAYIASRDTMLMIPFLKEIRAHKISCLESLNRHKEARSLERQVIREARKSSDAYILNILRQEGRMQPPKGEGLSED